MQKLRRGGKAMAARIRRAVVAVALALLMVTALAGVAWAATLIGNAGDNNLRGTSEKDVIYGMAGGDAIDGRGKADELHGGSGNDEILGRSGNDYLVGGRGYDELNAHNGNDRIEAADGKIDTIDCGPGDADRVSIDEKDFIRSCEIVIREQVAAQ
jgi:Ca2+-binding RTX toxin-like protein